MTAVSASVENYFEKEGKIITWVQYEAPEEPGKMEGFYCSFNSGDWDGQDAQEVVTLVGDGMDLPYMTFRE